MSLLNKDNKKSNEKEDKVECLGCSDKIEIDHLGVKCENSCNYCSDCSKNLVETLLSDSMDFPFKCFSCS